MVKYFWIKDFENSYRIIEKRINNENELKYTCIKTGVVSNFINEKSFIHRIQPPLMLNNIINCKNKDKYLSLIFDKMNFNDLTFKNVLEDLFIHKKRYDDVSIKYKKSKPSISRTVKKFKNFYYCYECDNVYQRKESDLISEGYYWAEINNKKVVILITKEDTKFLVKCFGLKKGITYDIDFIKSKILMKIDYPIDNEDIKTKIGVDKKINQIEKNGRIYNIKTKEAVKDTILNNTKIIESSYFYNINSSNISRLRKKVLSNSCMNCGHII